MDLTKERKHVVLAHAEELDISDDHHFVVFDRVECVVDELRDIGRIAASQKLQRLFDAFGGLLQAFAFRVFANAFEDLVDVRSNVESLDSAGLIRRLTLFMRTQLQRCFVPSRRCVQLSSWGTPAGNADGHSSRKIL